MTSQGSPHGRFQRAVERGNLLAAETAARELGPLPLADALELLLLIAAKEPTRFERAAVRWFGRYCVETRGVDGGDAQLLLGALVSLREPVPTAGLETLALVADRHRVGSVVRAAKRHLASFPEAPSRPR